MIYIATYKSFNAIQNEINNRLVKAMTLTRDHIHKVLFKAVCAYYEEYTPVQYKRTGNLMESLSASKVYSDGNKISCSVGWDDDYLTFSYYKNIITGSTVLNLSFNNSMHGAPAPYAVPGEHDFWDEAMEELGGEEGIVNLFIGNCKKCGIPIQ